MRLAKCDDSVRARLLSLVVATSIFVPNFTERHPAAIGSIPS